MAVTHTFVTAKADGADASLVRASNWNADHTGTISSAMHGTFASGDLHTEYGGLAQAESVTGLWNFIASGVGGLTDYDLTVGDVATPDYGLIQMGDSCMGRTSYSAGSLDLNGAVIFRNVGGPVTGQVEFVWVESAGSSVIRFALPKAGVGNATYNPRSMLIAGPAVNNDDVVTVGYWQGQGIFDNLACDTGGDGADLGVQNDLEVEGDIFVDSIKESTTAAGVTIDPSAGAGVLLKDGYVRLGTLNQIRDAANNVRLTLGTTTVVGGSLRIITNLQVNGGVITDSSGLARFVMADPGDTQIYDDAEVLRVSISASAPYVTIQGDPTVQEVALKVIEGAILSQGDVTSGVGLIAAYDGGKAAFLTAGTLNAAFQFDNVGGFQIQSNDRARIVAGNPASSTTVMELDSSGHAGFPLAHPNFALYVNNALNDTAVFQGTDHCLVHIIGTTGSERSINLGTNTTTGLKWKMGMDNAPSSPDFRADFVIKQVNNANPEFVITTDSLFGMSRDGLAALPVGQLHVEQTSTSAAIPVLVLDQRDVSEQGIKFTLNAATPVDADINLFTVDVTGAPKLSWDESEDDFNFNKGVQVEGRDVNRYAYSVG